MVSGTVENINNSILLKIRCLIYILNILFLIKYNTEKYNVFIKHYNLLVDKKEIIDLNENISFVSDINEILKYKDTIFSPYTELQTLAISLDKIKDNYELGSVCILSNFYYNNDKNIYDKYQNFITSENIIISIEYIYTNLNKYIQLIRPNDSDMNIIKNLINLYKTHTFNKENNNLLVIKCICLNNLNNDLSDSLLICKNCGIIREDVGNTSDNETNNKEIMKNKHGSYDPSKHCKFWLERIQAKEVNDIPENILNTVKKCILLDKIKNKYHITCNLLRTYLKNNNNSNYNEHIPLIRKLITGVSPPQLSDKEVQLVYIYFSIVIDVFEIIKPNNKTNCPYHPFFIYKIIEQILNKTTDRIRKLNLLECIHLQSRETLINNDLIWNGICSYIPEFTYIPTDKNNKYIS